MRQQFSVFVLCLLAGAWAISDEYIKELNSLPGLTWTAGRNPGVEKFADLNLAKLQHSVLPRRESSIDVSSLPEEFDFRKEWPDCVPEVINQGQCGSCYAAGGVTAFGHRACLATGKNETKSLQWLVSCDKLDAGCGGGSDDNVWEFLQEFGAPSNKCFPYVSGDGKTIPECPASCDDGSKMDFVKADDVYAVGPNEQEIMKEMTKGAVEMCFTVYSDFMAYRGGVYQHTKGARPEGGHCITCGGYGVENGSPYWLCQNSWGSDWGIEGGFFKILRGSNECDIESTVAAGSIRTPGPTPTPKVPLARGSYITGGLLEMKVIMPGYLIDVNTTIVENHFYDSKGQSMLLISSFDGASKPSMELTHFGKGTTYDIQKFFERVTCEKSDAKWFDGKWEDTLVPTDSVYSGKAIFAKAICDKWVYTIHSDMMGATIETTFFVTPGQDPSYMVLAGRIEHTTMDDRPVEEIFTTTYNWNQPSADKELSACN